MEEKIKSFVPARDNHNPYSERREFPPPSARLSRLCSTGQNRISGTSLLPQQFFRYCSPLYSKRLTPLHIISTLRICVAGTIQTGAFDPFVFRVYHFLSSPVSLRHISYTQSDYIKPPTNQPTGGI